MCYLKKYNSLLAIVISFINLYSNNHKSSTDLPMFLQYENLEADNYEDYEWIKNNSSELFFNIPLRESTNKNNYINSDFRQDTHYKDEMVNFNVYFVDEF